MPPQGSEAAAPRVVDAPTRTVTVEGARFVYRDLGRDGADGVPLVALTHLGANLDSWDPDLIDPLAMRRRVILIGYRGVGAATGAVRTEFEGMAADAIGVIRALGLSTVDVFGLSMGGMVAQVVAERAPGLVDRMVLASTGPQGGPGLTRMTGVMVRGIARGAATITHPTSLLFFTRTPAGVQAAQAYRARLGRRRVGRDRRVTVGVMRAQLRAVKRWGRCRPASARSLAGPVLILHGDSDRMVPAGNVGALLARFPSARTQVFPDSGHGVVFQHPAAIAATIDNFLRR